MIWIGFYSPSISCSCFPDGWVRPLRFSPLNLFVCVCVCVYIYIYIYIYIYVYMYMLMWSIFLGALTGMICRSEACFFVYVSSSMLDKTIYLLLNLVSMCRHHLL